MLLFKSVSTGGIVHCKPTLFIIASHTTRLSDIHERHEASHGGTVVPHVSATGLCRRMEDTKKDPAVRALHGLMQATLAIQDSISTKHVSASSQISRGKPQGSSHVEPLVCVQRADATWRRRWWRDRQACRIPFRPHLCSLCFLYDTPWDCTFLFETYITRNRIACGCLRPYRLDFAAARGVLCFFCNYGHAATLLLCAESLSGESVGFVDG